MTMGHVSTPTCKSTTATLLYYFDTSLEYSTPGAGLKSLTAPRSFPCSTSVPLRLHALPQKLLVGYTVAEGDRIHLPLWTYGCTCLTAKYSMALVEGSVGHVVHRSVSDRREAPTFGYRKHWFGTYHSDISTVVVPSRRRCLKS